MEILQNLQHLARAGASVLHIPSYEWERVRGWTIRIALDLKLPLKVWSQSTGLQKMSEDGTLSVDDDSQIDPLEILREIHASELPGLWLMEDFHPFLREEHHQILRWVREIARLPTTPRKLIVLSTPIHGLPVDLRKEVPTIELPLPGVEDLRVVLDDAARQRCAGRARAAPAIWASNIGYLPKGAHVLAAGSSSVWWSCMALSVDSLASLEAKCVELFV